MMGRTLFYPELTGTNTYHKNGSGLLLSVRALKFPRKLWLSSVDPGLGVLIGLQQSSLISYLNSRLEFAFLFPTVSRLLYYAKPSHVERSTSVEG